MYQIIWTSSNAKAIERLNSDKNFLLDNLSAILPSQFKLDQIVGDVSIFPVSLTFNSPIFCLNKYIFVGDSYHTFHPVGGQGLNTCLRDVNAIFDILNKNSFYDSKFLKLLAIKYYFIRFLDICSIIAITCLLYTSPSPRD